MVSKNYKKNKRLVVKSGKYDIKIGLARQKQDDFHES